MFNWREFGHWSDQFPGHPNAINSIVAVTDNVVITACEDGVIRAVHLYPHRFVGMKNRSYLLTDQLNLSQPGGAHYPHPVLCAPQIFDPCCMPDYFSDQIQSR